MGQLGVIGHLWSDRSISQSFYVLWAKSTNNHIDYNHYGNQFESDIAKLWKLSLFSLSATLQLQML